MTAEQCQQQLGVAPCAWIDMGAEFKFNRRDLEKCSLLGVLILVDRLSRFVDRASIS